MDAGADPEARNSVGNTSLLIASWLGRTENVRLLLERGANLDARNNEGTDALTAAQRQGHDDVVAILRAAKRGREILDRH